MSRIRFAFFLIEFLFVCLFSDDDPDADDDFASHFDCHRFALSCRNMHKPRLNLRTKIAARDRRDEPRRAARRRHARPVRRPRRSRRRYRLFLMFDCSTDVVCHEWGVWCGELGHESASAIVCYHTTTFDHVVEGTEFILCRLVAMYRNFAQFFNIIDISCVAMTFARRSTRSV